MDGGVIIFLGFIGFFACMFLKAGIELNRDKKKKQKEFEARKLEQAIRSREEENRVSLWAKRQELLDQKLNSLKKKGFLINKPDWATPSKVHSPYPKEINHIEMANIYDALHHKKLISVVQYDVEKDLAYFDSNYKSEQLVPPHLEIHPAIRPIKLLQNNRDDVKNSYMEGIDPVTGKSLMIPVGTVDVSNESQAQTNNVAFKLIHIPEVTLVENTYQFDRQKMNEIILEVLRDSSALEIIYIDSTENNMPGNYIAHKAKVEVNTVGFPFFDATYINTNIKSEFALESTSYLKNSATLRQSIRNDRSYETAKVQRFVIGCRISGEKFVSTSPKTVIPSESVAQNNPQFAAIAERTPGHPQKLTFANFVGDLKAKKISVKPGKPFVNGKPNSIAGYVGARLKGMKTPYARNGKEMTHHRILKSVFGFDQEATKAIKAANDAGFKNIDAYQKAYERKRRQRNRSRRPGPIYSKGNSLYGGNSSINRISDLCENIPSIGNARIELKTLPKRWRKVYGSST